MEYHNTKDVKHVQYILGHKHSDTTDVYINLEQATFLQNNDQWITKVSHNLEEEAQLIEAGFELVRSINETTAIYKKRKWKLLSCSGSFKIYQFGGNENKRNNTLFKKHISASQ